MTDLTIAQLEQLESMVKLNSDTTLAEILVRMAIEEIRRRRTHDEMAQALHKEVADAAVAYRLARGAFDQARRKYHASAESSDILWRTLKERGHGTTAAHHALVASTNRLIAFRDSQSHSRIIHAITQLGMDVEVPSHLTETIMKAALEAREAVRDITRTRDTSPTDPVIGPGSRDPEE
jgi:hypothetical protein